MIQMMDRGSRTWRYADAERTGKTGTWPRFRWALSTFQPIKSVGTDEIVLALLQQWMEHLVPYLSHIFRAYLAYGYISMAWRQVRVMLIPKPGKSDYTEAKAYHSAACYLSF
jgi:hypothetical protein